MLKANILDTFFNDHQSRFSEETIRSYRLSLNQFFSFCGVQYDEVKVKDIRAWLASMEERDLKKVRFILNYQV
ncbi:site-specific integrase [Niallia taxi]|uniref:site-specific integrase n=1 Tax=Niallia taxi TaxID=2499688 RepID=UPI001CD9FE6C|nr:site-specific integrase [Niallia taxi]